MNLRPEFRWVQKLNGRRIGSVPDCELHHELFAGVGMEESGTERLYRVLARWCGSIASKNDSRISKVMYFRNRSTTSRKNQMVAVGRPSDLKVLQRCSYC